MDDSCSEVSNKEGIMPYVEIQFQIAKHVEIFHETEKEQAGHKGGSFPSEQWINWVEPT